MRHPEHYRSQELNPRAEHETRARLAGARRYQGVASSPGLAVGACQTQVCRVLALMPCACFGSDALCGAPYHNQTHRFWLTKGGPEVSASEKSQRCVRRNHRATSFHALPPAACWNLLLFSHVFHPEHRTEKDLWVNVAGHVFDVGPAAPES
jgi:hypothetical protein